MEVGMKEGSCVDNCGSEGGGRYPRGLCLVALLFCIFEISLNKN